MVIPGRIGRAGERRAPRRRRGPRGASARSRRPTAPGPRRGARPGPTRRRAAAGSRSGTGRVGLSWPGRTLALADLVAALELLAAPAPAGVVRLQHPVARRQIGHGDEGYRCHDGSMPPLDPLPQVQVESIELLRVPMRLSTPLRTAAGQADRARRAPGARAGSRRRRAGPSARSSPSPRYAAEFTDAAILALRDHLIPRALAGPTGDALARRAGPRTGPRAPDGARVAASWPCSTPSCGRRTDRWRLARRHRHDGAGRAPPSACTTTSPTLLDEADAALAAGAARLRVKVAPGRAAVPLLALRDHVGDRRDAAGGRQRVLHRGRSRARPPRRASTSPASSSRWRRTTSSATPGWRRGSTRPSASTSRSPRSAPSRPPSPSARARSCA